MSKIAIVKGKDRKENIRRTVELIRGDIEKEIRIKKSKQLFIKINAIDINYPLACTHLDALDSVLNIFYDRFDEIIVGDNSFAFTKNKGGPYRVILNKFPKVKLSDLSEFKTEDIEFKRLDGKIGIGKISLMHKKAFTVSLSLPKTHDAFVYTGCLKNMFGCVIKNRGDLHALSTHERIFLKNYVRSNKLKWYNLVNVIKKIKPDLCILDAYEGMEGDGPIFGNKVQLEMAMCSLDGVALDKVASKIFGFENVPYLSMLGGSVNHEIVKDGFESIDEISRKFKPHYKNRYQTMVDSNPLMPLIDIELAISILKRPYRLKDKIIEKLRVGNAHS